eukprot:750904-Hanusia_phi.AAC.5
MSSIHNSSLRTPSPNHGQQVLIGSSQNLLLKSPTDCSWPRAQGAQLLPSGQCASVYRLTDQTPNKSPHSPRVRCVPGVVLSLIGCFVSDRYACLKGGAAFKPSSSFKVMACASQS